MKNHFYIYIILVAIILSACDLTKSIDEIKPLNVLEAETAISNSDAAELALTGLYSSLRLSATDITGFQPYFGSTASQLGLTGGLPSNTPNENSSAFTENTPNASLSTLKNMYGAAYTIIYRSNWLIEKVSLLDENMFSSNRKSEILGEAKCIRAMVNQYLLRLFGQFYDLNSGYGIVLKTIADREAQAMPRSTVNEVYEQILLDLDYAILNAPDFKAHYYVSKTAAKGIKTRVLLYMANFDEAASVAKEIIDNNTDEYELVPEFSSIFEPIPNNYNSPECLFSIFTDGGSVNNYNVYYGWYATINPNYITLASEGSVDIDGTTILYDGIRVGLLNPVTGKYPSGGLETHYHQRMAEVYLIYAEAETRKNGGNLTDALEKLNMVRERAGVQLYPQTISKDGLLEAIRIEKIMELAAENGEEYFDMIRYAYLDGGFESGIRVSDYKPTATNIKYLTMPIPISSIRLNGGIVVQNPGY